MGNKYKSPKTEITADFGDLIALRLAKKGWCNGDPTKIMKMEGMEVMKMYHYQNFLQEYEAAFLEINKGSEK